MPDFYHSKCSQNLQLCYSAMLITIVFEVAKSQYNSYITVGTQFDSNPFYSYLCDISLFSDVLTRYLPFCVRWDSRHMNVIQFKESFLDVNSQTLCLVMEFAENGDVLQKIEGHFKRSTCFPEYELWSALI